MSTSNREKTVFISCSEDSKKFAEILGESIFELELGAAFVATKDIRGGDDWFDEILEALTTAKVGIVCFTRANINRPWLYFESGVIAYKYFSETKTVDKQERKHKLISLFINLSPKDVDGFPFKNIQAVYLKGNADEEVVDKLAEVFVSIGKSKKVPSDEQALKNIAKNEIIKPDGLLETVRKINAIEDGLLDNASVSTKTDDFGAWMTFSSLNVADDEISRSVKVIECISKWFVVQRSKQSFYCKDSVFVSYSAISDFVMKTLSLTDDQLKDSLLYLKSEGFIVTENKMLDLHGKVEKFISLTAKAKDVLL
ncbi:MAG: toll/interleukin-1 receptor domain-containing protein [Candidatus Thiothrix moscowensis]|nr:toll/interleukin-1 receptor domain-containing protein [Candidatus Thiothrix moscowensis]